MQPDEEALIAGYIQATFFLDSTNKPVYYNQHGY